MCGAVLKCVEVRICKGTKSSEAHSTPPTSEGMARRSPKTVRRLLGAFCAFGNLAARRRVNIH